MCNEITLIKFKFSFQKYISQLMLNEINYDIGIDEITKDIIVRITHRPFGEIIETIQYPDGWKESIKEAFFDWFEKKNMFLSFNTWRKKCNDIYKKGGYMNDLKEAITEIQEWQSQKENKYEQKQQTEINIKSIKKESKIIRKDLFSLIYDLLINNIDSWKQDKFDAHMIIFKCKNYYIYVRWVGFGCCNYVKIGKEDNILLINNILLKESFDCAFYKKIYKIAKKSIIYLDQSQKIKEINKNNELLSIACSELRGEL